MPVLADRAEGGAGEREGVEGCLILELEDAFELVVKYVGRVDVDADASIENESYDRPAFPDCWGMFGVPFLLPRVGGFVLGFGCVSDQTSPAKSSIYVLSENCVLHSHTNKAST